MELETSDKFVTESISDPTTSPFYDSGIVKATTALFDQLDPDLVRDVLLKHKFNLNLATTELCHLDTERFNKWRQEEELAMARQREAKEAERLRELTLKRNRDVEALFEVMPKLSIDLIQETLERHNWDEPVAIKELVTLLANMEKEEQAQRNREEMARIRKMEQKELLHVRRVIQDATSNHDLSKEQILEQIETALRVVPQSVFAAALTSPDFTFDEFSEEDEVKSMSEDSESDCTTTPLSEAISSTPARQSMLLAAETIYPQMSIGDVKSIFNSCDWDVEKSIAVLDEQSQNKANELSKTEMSMRSDLLSRCKIAFGELSVEQIQRTLELNSYNEYQSFVELAILKKQQQEEENLTALRRKSERLRLQLEKELTNQRQSFAERNKIAQRLSTSYNVFVDVWDHRKQLEQEHLEFTRKSIQQRQSALEKQIEIHTQSPVTEAPKRPKPPARPSTQYPVPPPKQNKVEDQATNRPRFDQIVEEKEKELQHSSQKRRLTIKSFLDALSSRQSVEKAPPSPSSSQPTLTKSIYTTAASKRSSTSFPQPPSSTSSSSSSTPLHSPRTNPNSPIQIVANPLIPPLSSKYSPDATQRAGSGPLLSVPVEYMRQSNETLILPTIPKRLATHAALDESEGSATSQISKQEIPSHSRNRPLPPKPNVRSSSALSRPDRGREFSPN